MTRFVVINPRKRTVEAVTFDDVVQAMATVGLASVDHGVLGRGLGYCIYEHSLFVPPSEQHYCGLGGHLIAGPAVLYGFDHEGETVDLLLSQIPDVTFYLGVNDVEAAIYRGEIERPFIAVNGVRHWEWPQPAPNNWM